MLYLVKNVSAVFLFFLISGCTHLKKNKSFETPLQSTIIDLNQSKASAPDLSDLPLPSPSYVFIFIILLIVVAFFTSISWLISKK